MDAEVEEDHTSGIPRGPTQIDEEQPDEYRPRTPTEDQVRRPATATGAELGQSQSPARKRRGPLDEFRPSPLQRAFTHVGDIFRDAHAEDFERKTKPELGHDPRDANKMEEDDTDDESDNDEEQEEVPDENGSDGADSRNSDAELEVDNEVEDDEEQSALSRIREDCLGGLSCSMPPSASTAWIRRRPPRQSSYFLQPSTASTRAFGTFTTTGVSVTRMPSTHSCGRNSDTKRCGGTTLPCALIQSCDSTG